MRLRAYTPVAWATILTSWTPLFRLVAAQGNTTCKGTTLDWYTNEVGETPCKTYQRLRQICNSAYTVGSLSVATPGDNCDEQVADCCCNSVAFALSMLCLNCQQGVGSGVGGDTGIDAGAGAYQLYLTKSSGNRCSPNFNQSIGAIQSAVCNSGIKIHDDLYGLFWGTGDWFYEYTRQTIEKDNTVLGNNTFTHCNSTTLNATSSAPAGSSLSPSGAATLTDSSHPSISTDTPGQDVQPVTRSSIGPGAIAGIVIGVVILLLAVAALAWFLRRRRRIRLEEEEPPVVLEMDPAQREPFVIPTTPRPNAPPHLASTAALSSTSAVSTNSPSMTESSGPLLSGYGEKSYTSLRLANGGDADHTYAEPAAMDERHEDAGPVLGRSPSGRLPPAYGAQR